MSTANAAPVLPSPERQLSTYQAEYSAMRAEIVQLSNKQQNLLIASFAVSGYAFTSFATSATTATTSSEGSSHARLPSTSQVPTVSQTTAVSTTNSSLDPGGFWILLCLVLCAFGLLFCDVDRAIIRCATYINYHVRQKLVQLTGDPEVLDWENFIRGRGVLKHFRNKPLRTALPATGCFVEFFRIRVYRQELYAWIVIQSAVGLAAISWFSVRLWVVGSQRLRSSRRFHRDPTS